MCKSSQDITRKCIEIVFIFRVYKTNTSIPSLPRCMCIYYMSCWCSATFVLSVRVTETKFLQLKKSQHSWIQLAWCPFIFSVSNLQVSTGQVESQQWSQRAVSLSWWASWLEEWSMAYATLLPRLSAPMLSSSFCSRPLSWTRATSCQGGCSLKTSAPSSGWYTVNVCVYDCVGLCAKAVEYTFPYTFLTY